MKTTNVHSKVREEAEQWFVRRLEPAARESECRAFERWLTQDGRHEEAYAQTERLWDQLAVLRSSTRLRAVALPAESAAITAPTMLPLKHKRRVSFQGALALAACITAIAILIAIRVDDVRSGAEAFATALGEQRTETLDDGTTLRLNTHSAVEVRMTRSRREVLLVNGEAAFDVARDVSRPFVVSAGDGTVTAKSTHFQVRHEGHQVTVTLMEGRVQLARNARDEIEWLDPGQQATFVEGKSGIICRNVDVRALTSWMNGRLEFRSAPLEDVVWEANRYSARKIRIADPAINEIAVSGTFRTGDIDGVATALEAAFPVRANIGKDEIVLVAP